MAYQDLSVDLDKIYIPKSQYDRLPDSYKTQGVYSSGAGIGTGTGINTGTTTNNRLKQVIGGSTSATLARCNHYYDQCGFINSDGYLYMWGSGVNGVLGQNNTIDYNFPVRVGSTNDWLQGSLTLSMSAYAVKNNGTLWSWGNNAYGQLGSGTITNRSSPVQVGALTNWTHKIAVSSLAHVLAIKADGTLWSWGSNYSGELGSGTITNRSSPVQVGTMTNWLSVAATSSGTYSSSFAIKTDGTLWSWGVNDVGQLGSGTITSRSSPVQVGAMTDWAKLGACSAACMFAIKTNGTLWAWGQNDSGQLGLGDTINRSSPVQVGTLTDWMHIAASDNRVVAIKTDGTLWAWGNNISGQLGLGDTIARSSPVQVGTLASWSNIAISLDAIHAASL